MKTELIEINIPWETGGEVSVVDIIPYRPFYGMRYDYELNLLTFKSSFEHPVLFRNLRSRNCFEHLYGFTTGAGDGEIMYHFEIDAPDCFAKQDSWRVSISY